MWMIENKKCRDSLPFFRISRLPLFGKNGAPKIPEHNIIDFVPKLSSYSFHDIFKGIASAHIEQWPFLAIF